VSHRLVWCVAVAALLSTPGAGLGQGRLLILASSDLTIRDLEPDAPGSVDHILSAGIGQTPAPAVLVSYAGFSLEGLPVSTRFRTVVIDEAELSLMATSFGLASAERRFLVTVQSCDGANWDPKTATWNNPPCAATASETSVLIVGTALPRTYEWDVARGVARASKNGAGGLTFAISAVPILDCDRDPLEGTGCQVDDLDRRGFVRFASSAREAYGIGAIPHLTVRYSLQPTTLKRIIEVTLSILSAIALTFGLYKSIMGFLGRKSD